MTEIWEPLLVLSTFKRSFMVYYRNFYCTCSSTVIDYRIFFEARLLHYRSTHRKEWKITEFDEIRWSECLDIRQFPEIKHALLPNISYNRILQESCRLHVLSFMTSIFAVWFHSILVSYLRNSGRFIVFMIWITTVERSPNIRSRIFYFPALLYWLNLVYVQGPILNKFERVK